MPIGLGFQRKHRKIGYLLKYVYYCVKRRNVLEKRLSLGELNSNKIIYVIKPDYQDGVEGLLSLIYRQLIYIDYAKKEGYVPFVDWQNYRTQYYDGKNNVWEFFFKQPSNICIDDVYRSKNVYLSGWTLKDKNPNGYFSSKVFFDNDFRMECALILNKYLHYSEEVIHKVEKEAELLNISECIGVYIRGTDYMKLKPKGEYIQPTVEQVIPVIKEFCSKYSNSNIFLVTEDGNIYDYLKREFDNYIKVVSFDSFVRNYSGESVLSKSNVLNEDKKKRGQDYLVKMILLSKCKYLIASITQGSKFSYILNNGKYEDEYIFDLGLYS